MVLELCVFGVVVPVRIYAVPGVVVGVVDVICFVWKDGVVSSVDDVLRVVDHIGVVSVCCVVVCVWHGTVTFVQHLNLTS